MQQITMDTTNKELVGILQGLYGVQTLQGLKFALSVSKNIKIIRDELEDIEMAATPSPEFIELSRQVAELEKKKDEKGIKKLEKENKKLVETRKTQLKELEEIMKEKTKVNLIPISEEVLPKEITAGQLNGIQTLIQ
jgi:hypothetical protein